MQGGTSCGTVPTWYWLDWQHCYALPNQFMRLRLQHKTCRGMVVAQSGIARSAPQRVCVFMPVLTVALLASWPKSPPLGALTPCALAECMGGKPTQLIHIPEHSRLDVVPQLGKHCSPQLRCFDNTYHCDMKQRVASAQCPAPDRRTSIHRLPPAALQHIAPTGPANPWRALRCWACMPE